MREGLVLEPADHEELILQKCLTTLVRAVDLCREMLVSGPLRMFYFY